MSTETIITVDRIEKLAGAARFRLGLENMGRIPIQKFSLEHNRSSAVIAGFKVSLVFKNGMVESACECPESDGFEFCEHCVQLAMHTLKISQQMLSLAKGPDKSKVLAYLLSLDKQDLAKQMLAQLEQDKDSFQRYLLKASMSKESFNWKDLRKELTQLTKPPKGLFSQRQVKAFFAKLTAFFEVLIEDLPKDENESLFKLLAYGVKRLNSLLDKLEDRSDSRAKTVELFRQLFDISFSRVEWSAGKKAEQLFSVWKGDHHNVLDRDPNLYLELDSPTHKTFVALVEQGYKEFRARLGNDLNEVGTQESSRASSQQSLKTYARYLIDPQQNDLVQYSELELREVLIDSVDAAIQLAQEWLDEGQEAKAMSLLERVLLQYPESKQAIRFVFNLIRRTDSLDKIELETQQERLFQFYQTHPIVLHDLFLECIENSSERELWMQRAINFLLIERPEGADNCLVEMLLKENLYPKIAQCFETLKLDACARIALAPQLFKALPSLAIEIYQTELENLFNKNMLSADKKAAELVYELEQLNKSSLLDLESFSTWVRSQIRGRPKFVEIYRGLNQDETPRVLG